MNGKSVILKFSLIIILIVVAFLGYRFFFATPSPATPAGLVGLAPTGAQGSQASDEFVTLLVSLQAINLNDLPRIVGLLNGLEDFSTDLQPQQPGRNNPFAPIGIGGRVTVESTAATTTQTASSTTATSTKK